MQDRTALEDGDPCGADRHVSERPERDVDHTAGAVPNRRKPGSPHLGSGSDRPGEKGSRIGPVASFRSFWTCYRCRAELAGLPLAAVRALLGAREERFSGYLRIRDDLDPSCYLDVPFVRRSWYLLRMLDDAVRNGEVGKQGDEYVGAGGAGAGCIGTDLEDPNQFDAEGSGSACRGSGPAISWAMTRALGMDAASARVNISVLLTLLVGCGYIDPTVPIGLTSRAIALVRGGSVGEFYKSLCIRVFNRAPWVFDDGLPPLVAIQLNGLFLLHTLGTEESGRSAFDLAGTLETLSRILALSSDPDSWVPNRQVIATAIHSRMLARVGRILGLIEASPVSAGGVTLPIRQLYRTTDLCRLAFRWNP
ncbi:MAG: hypothetical protein ACLFSV_08355 [Alkalispirochaeta sp.]